MSPNAIQAALRLHRWQTGPHHNTYLVGSDEGRFVVCPHCRGRWGLFVFRNGVVIFDDAEPGTGKCQENP